MQDPLRTPMAQRLENLRGIGQLEELHSYFKAYLQATGTEFFLMVDATMTDEHISRAILLHNLPVLWLDRYARKNYIRDDPVALHCRETHEPFLWQDVLERHANHPNAANIASEAREHGLVWGIGVPVHEDRRCAGWVSLAARQSVYDASVLPRLQMVCTEIFHKARSLRQAAIRRAARLTQRERETLMLCSIGKTSADIARELSVAETTVVSHLQNAMMKLGVRNRVAAVADAIRSGIINF